MSDNHDYVACPNCDWKGATSKLDDAQDLLQRLEPGDIVPDGQCPDCGALVCESNPLVAAAPDLLAALRGMLDKFQYDTLPEESGWDEVETARAAIAKAEGRGS